MKNKILLGAILTLIIGTQAFARGRGYGGEHRGRFNYSNPAFTCGAIANNAFQNDREGNFNGSGHRFGGRFGKSHMMNNPEFEKLSIAMDEKRLEIRKEMVKDAPDWSKIEKLNTDMATEMAKFKTQMMKTRYEEMKKFQAEMDKKAVETPVTPPAVPQKTN
ncbi:hypothetical protein [Fusobacterium sp. PH5-44]|uniref:hypothetical protein n=1 Tax=unclassified Fusobacterium TaxID=2648384 RepID=UPI003D221173